MLKTIPVSRAVGMVLAHDVTRIVPGQQKGAAFKKGHIIAETDIPVLLDIGKEHVYVLDLQPGYIHEDEAAERIARAAVGPGLRLTKPAEGRVNLVTTFPGLLKIDVAALADLNAIDEVVFATLHSNHRVPGSRAVAGTRVIPLVIEEEKIVRAERVCRSRHPVIRVKPFRSFRVGLVTTGSEVYHGRIRDGFGPVVVQKFEALGSRIMRRILVADDVATTIAAIHGLIEEGAEMVVVTGGMSVDPDDQTPLSICKAGGRVITYGAPVFPGAMFMLAYIGDIPVLGLPGCVMYFHTSVFDLIVPRLLAGEQVSRSDIVALGHGGFCAGCAECRYPVCGFGKG
jgi:molybdopterin biosynthesis enzyme